MSLSNSAGTSDSVRGNKNQKLDVAEEQKFDEYHKRLAGIVKTLHSDLRQRVKQSEDIDKAWLDHCSDVSRLKEYSEAMHHLAVDVWEKQRSTRIDWCRDICLEYFFNPTGLRKILQKESRRISYHRKSCDECGHRLTNERNKNGGIKSAEGVVDKYKVSLINKRCDNSCCKSECRPTRKHCSDSNGCGEELCIKYRKVPWTENHNEHCMSQNNDHSVEFKKESITGNMVTNHYGEHSRGDLGAQTTDVYKLDEYSTEESNTKRTNEFNVSPSRVECREISSTNVETKYCDEHSTVQSKEHAEESNIRCANEPNASRPNSLCNEERTTGSVNVKVPQPVGILPVTEEPDPECCANQSSDLSGAMDACRKEEHLLHSEKILRELEASWPLCDGEKIRLLDVGSCYNGFDCYKEFDTVAIDLCPAVESVLQCDFLSLEVLPLHKILSTDATPRSPSSLSDLSMENPAVEFSQHLLSLRSPLTQLAEQCFHVMVFSLLLEYLPSPRQRLLCCDKAWRLLADNGLLMVVTPDSHHASRRSDMMRAWRQAIESLGFLRWRYEKQEHLHCMAFRKVFQLGQNIFNPIGSRPLTCAGYNSYRRLPLDDIDANLLYIPQDNREETDRSDNVL